MLFLDYAVMWMCIKLQNEESLVLKVTWLSVITITDRHTVYTGL